MFMGTCHGFEVFLWQEDKKSSFRRPGSGHTAIIHHRCLDALRIKKPACETERKQRIWKHARSRRAAAPGSPGTPQEQVCAAAHPAEETPVTSSSPGAKSLLRGSCPDGREDGWSVPLSPRSPAGRPCPGASWGGLGRPVCPADPADPAGHRERSPRIPRRHSPPPPRTHRPVIVHPQKVSGEDLQRAGGAGVHESPLEDVCERRALRGAHGGGFGSCHPAGCLPSVSPGAAGGFLELSPFPHPLVTFFTGSGFGARRAGGGGAPFAFPGGRRTGERGRCHPRAPRRPCPIPGVSARGPNARWGLGSHFLPEERWEIRQGVW